MNDAAPLRSVTKADPVITEIVRNCLIAATEEMKTNLMRTAYNMIIYEALDFTVGLFDAEGNILSIGLGLPMFIRGIADTIRAKIKHFGPDGIEPGDILLTNDAYITGSHLNHMTFSVPIFHEGRLVAFSGCMAHWPDVGGTLDGITTDIFSEGLQMPIVKAYRRGEPNEEILSIIQMNVRLPERAMGDLRAQLASVKTGEKRFQEMIQKYGCGEVLAAIDDIMAQSEARARERVRAFPDGVYEAESFMDDDGVAAGQRVPIRVKVIIAGDRMTIDLTDVSSQVSGFYNSGETAGKSCCGVAFKCLTSPLDLLIPEGEIMKVRFGVSVLSGTAFPHRRDLDTFAELIRIIDGSGVELIGTNDTSFIGGDAYVRATLIAQTAKNARVGIHPTNPLTREPQIMAAFMASMDAMTEGRAFLDIGSGDSAVYNIGLAPASRARMEDYVTCVRDLIANGEGTYAGRPQRVRWHREAVRKRIPITLCAEGPKTLHLGGRIFDGVIAGTGLLPEVISDTIERVAVGAAEAGRDPSEVEVWFTTRSSLDAERDTAIKRIHASVSSILNHSMRFGLEGKNVPTQFRAKIAEYLEGYELYDHVLQAGRNPKRMAELGLTEYGLERFALAGNANDWIDRIGELAELGASRLWLSTESGDLDRQIHYMKVFTEQVMPHFR